MRLEAVEMENFEDGRIFADEIHRTEGKLEGFFDCGNWEGFCRFEFDEVSEG